MALPRTSAPGARMRPAAPTRRTAAPARPAGQAPAAAKPAAPGVRMNAPMMRSAAPKKKKKRGPFQEMLSSMRITPGYDSRFKRFG